MTALPNLTVAADLNAPSVRTVAHPDAASPPRTKMRVAVEQAIDEMAENLWCDNGIEGLAANSFYSKFHFTREFSRLTGTTARRYLAALRMHRAKELLRNTDLGVAHVSSFVGYSSVGTFSTRFSQLVGTSPRAWRKNPDLIAPISPLTGTGAATIRGSVRLNDQATEWPTDIFIAAFEDSTVQGVPAACTRMQTAGGFELRGLAPGDWTVTAVVSTQFPTAEGGIQTEVLRDRAIVRCFTDTTTSSLPVRLTPRATTNLDPPIILSGVRVDHTERLAMSSF